MAKLKYKDLMFNFEKCIKWDDIAKILGKEDHFDEEKLSKEEIKNKIQHYKKMLEMED